MLELGEGDVMEELDEELTGDITLIGGESFNSNEDGRGSDNENVKGMDVRCGEGVNEDG